MPPTPTTTAPPPVTTAAPIELNFYTTGHMGFMYDIGRLGWKPVERYMAANPNIKVNTYVDSFFDVYTKEATTFAAGTYAWDVAYEWGGIMNEMAHYWTPLDEMGITLDPEVIDDMVPYSRNAVLWKGHYYGLPRMLEVFALMANADILDAKGIEFPRTYEEFLEACEEVNDPKNGVYAFEVGLKAGYNFTTYLTFLHGNGGSLWKNDSMQTMLPDSKESIQAVEDLVHLFKNYMPPSAIEKIAFAEGSTDWYNGQMVFALYYGHSVMAVIDPGSKVKRCYYWLWPGKRGVVRSGSQVACEGYGIPKTAKYKKEAWDFIQYLSSREVQVQCTLGQGWKQENEEPIPSYWSYMTDDRLKEYPYNIIMRAQLAALKYKANRYERPAYMSYIPVIEAEISNALTGVKKPADAMKDAREACDKILEKEYATYGGGYYDPWPDMQKYASRIDDMIDAIPVEDQYKLPF
jgi:multiple sugar transport system substrate-binding protein